MKKEKKASSVKLEKHELDTCPMIVCKVEKSIPKMRPVKSKERIKAATSKSKSTSAREATTCETSGNIMKLCVNLMPVLAAAKEPVEEEEERKEDNECTSKKKPETSCKNDPSVTKSEEQILSSFTGLNLDTDTKQAQSPWLVLPPITQPKPAPECCDRQRGHHTPLPPISPTEQTRTISSNVTIRGCRGDGLVTGHVADSRPWMDNPLFSKSRSPEFRLPDISLSSLDALLQTVTQKLGRKRRGYDEGRWTRVHSDQLLAAVSERRLRERSGTENKNLANIEAVTETSVGGCSVNSQRSLPPLSSAPKPTLIHTMTKKNLLTSSMLQ
ncbi:uncharacterized protein LOC117253826 [Epinephelus lanceolatus]|uniref:uncharacterized protein LOC117253826 n=1 Tax=Epinephelus lanceolatus TaxID=310571 RepID=UPI0014469748|nr:uncharacterized protein LOC117253826 [Epinephelus lanceolatus]